METTAPGFYTGRPVHPPHIVVRMSGAMLCGEQRQDELTEYAGSLPPAPADCKYSGYLIPGVFAAKLISPGILFILSSPV